VTVGPIECAPCAAATRAACRRTGWAELLRCRSDPATRPTPRRNRSTTGGPAEARTGDARPCRTPRYGRASEIARRPSGARSVPPLCAQLTTGTEELSKQRQGNGWPEHECALYPHGGTAHHHHRARPPGAPDARQRGRGCGPGRGLGAAEGHGGSPGPARARDRHDYRHEPVGIGSVEPRNRQKRRS
jgi:hypothetical protein